MSGRNELQIESFTGQRGALAIDLLGEGRGVWIANFLLTRRPDDVWEIAVLEEALADREELIQDAKATICRLAAESEAFERLLRGRHVVFAVVADYGHGRVTLQWYPSEVLLA